MTSGPERSRWKVHDDRVIDENPLVRLSQASVELPDGTLFDQYVMRFAPGAMTVVLDEAQERVLLIWRHRFVIDRWLWELPGGFIDSGEDGAAAAAREVEEETGYRPRSIEHLLTFQPMAGTADSAFELYLARGADPVGTPDPNETESVSWIPLAEIPRLIASGEINGAATIIGIQQVLLANGHRSEADGINNDTIDDMAMTLRLTDDETEALRRRSDLEHRSMQEVARQAIREYVENHSRAELLDRVLDEELPRYAEALERLGQ